MGAYPSGKLLYYLGSFSETPAGTINGVNKIFTLTYIPVPPESLQLFQNSGGVGLGALLQIAGVDYTISGLTLTYTTAPINLSVHRAFYRYGP